MSASQKQTEKEEEVTHLLRHTRHRQILDHLGVDSVVEILEVVVPHLIGKLIGLLVYNCI